MRIFLVCILPVLFLAQPVYAEDGRFQDEAEVSYVDTGGNTEVKTLSAKNECLYRFSSKIEGKWKISALYSESDNVKNAESYSSDIRLNHLFGKRFYSAFTASWLKDKFAGLDPRYSLGPAGGYKFLKGPKHFLHGETGLDYVIEKYTNGNDNDYLRGRLFTKYVYHFNKKNRVSQSLEYLYDFDNSENYNTISMTVVTSSLNDYFSLKSSFELKYDNEPAPDTLEKVDTVLSFALVFNFGN